MQITILCPKKIGRCCVRLSSNFQDLYQNCCRILQNPDARWFWMQQPVQTRASHAHSVVVVEAEEEDVDVDVVGVEVRVTEGTGARVEKVFEVGVVVEIFVATTADTEAVIQAMRVGVAIEVVITIEVEVVIQALKVEVATGVAITVELEVVIQALRAGKDITVKKEILAAVGSKEEIQVLMAGALRIRTGEVGQEILIKLENKSLTINVTVAVAVLTVGHITSGNMIVDTRHLELTA